MGLAIIVPIISFDDTNLGKVTLSGNVPIRGLYINLEDSYVGTTVDLKCSYLPANTTQRGVVWSIESGSEYASVSGSVLTILEGANNNDVVVKCTSTLNSSIFATKEISVSYNNGSKQPLQWIKTGYGNYVNTGIKLNDNYIYTIYWVCDTTLVSQPTGVTDVYPAVDKGFMIVCVNGELRVRWNNDDKGTSISSANGKTLKTTINGLTKKIITEDIDTGTILQNASVTGGASTNNIFLFARNNAGTPETQSITDSIIKRFTVEEDGQNILDLHPYLYGGTPVFIDKISYTIFNINGTNEIDYE